MNELKGLKVKIHDSELRRREQANKEYLMKLSSDNLLLNYRVEAGRFTARSSADAHTGWESPVCQLRGHFLGHWLSAAAIHYHTSKDKDIKAKQTLLLMS